MSADNLYITYTAFRLRDDTILLVTTADDVYLMEDLVNDRSVSHSLRKSIEKASSATLISRI